MFRQLVFKDLARIALLLDEEENKRLKLNRIWVHEILYKRKIEGEFFTFYREFIGDESKFYKYIYRNVYS
jgi:hypothetical protein